MLAFARKTCPDCGTQCLDIDPRCWACGAAFRLPGSIVQDPASGDGAAGGDAPDGGGVGERTLVDEPLGWQPTAAWGRRPGFFAQMSPRQRAWAAAAGIAAGVALAGFIGFQFGRQTSPAADARNQEPVQVAVDPSLPTKPRVLPRPPSGILVPAPPPVEIRDLPPRAVRPPAATGGPSAAPMPPAAPEHPAPMSTPAARPGPSLRSPAGAARSGPYSPPVQPPTAAPPAPARRPLDPKRAMLGFRNETSMNVRLQMTGFDGASDIEWNLAPDASFEYPVDAGEYRLRATASGAELGTGRAVLTRGRRFALVITAARSGDERPTLQVSTSPADEGP